MPIMDGGEVCNRPILNLQVNSRFTLLRHPIPYLIMFRLEDPLLENLGLLHTFLRFLNRIAP